MTLPKSLAFPALLAAAAVAAAVWSLAQAEKKFEPRVGQPGRDVVWVPTPQALVDRMLDMAKVGPDDFLIDLGSGDGRTVITAAKRGVKALGVEFNPNMVKLARAKAAKEDAKLATFVEGDLFKADLSQATVITLFLLPSINIKLRPQILDLKAGTRIVSNTFDMGDWSPDQTIQAEKDCVSWCRAHLWYVPAKVQGTWKLPDGELVLEQKYQMLTGTLGGKAIINGKMSGAQVTFSVGDKQYTGRVEGDAIEGDGWRATR